MDIGIRSLHPAAADHSVSIRGSRCTALIMLSLRSRAGWPGRSAMVQQLWRRDVTSPFPPSGNEGYIRNWDVPFQIPTKAPQELPLPAPCVGLLILPIRQTIGLIALPERMAPERGSGFSARPPKRNHTSNLEWLGCGGGFHTSPMFSAARESIAVISGSGSDNVTTPEVRNAAESSSPEQESSPSDAAIDSPVIRGSTEGNGWSTPLCRGPSQIHRQPRRLRSAWRVRNSTWGSPRRNPQIISDSTRCCAKTKYRFHWSCILLEWSVWFRMCCVQKCVILSCFLKDAQLLFIKLASAWCLEF